MLYRPLPIVALVVGVIAAPTEEPPCPEEPQCPQTICIDAINTCGVSYGGCYDSCIPSLKPTAPPCDTEPTAVLPSPTPISTDDCSTRTVCADYINDCGVWYGGCFPDCKPWPTFTPPPCTTTPSSVITPVPFPTPVTTDCHTETVCEDYINECGQTYGGCHSACTPWPTFTAPPCPATTTDAPVTTVTLPSASSTLVCADFLKTCTEGGTTAVLTYGGCYTLGRPTPTFPEPPCPTPTA